MILAESELRKALDTGDLRLIPTIAPTQITPASIDLRLSDKFILIDTEIEANKEAGVDNVIDTARYSFASFAKRFGTTKTVTTGESFVLTPHRLVLGYTKERVELTESLAGRVEGKSSLARLGLFVHITAPTIQPGFRNELQLELFNVGPAPLRLWPNMPICQLIVERVEGTGTYMGQFQAPS